MPFRIKFTAFSNQSSINGFESKQYQWERRKLDESGECLQDLQTGELIVTGKNETGDQDDILPTIL